MSALGWKQPASCLNGKTARSWRGIVALTHLAREGRMTVTIGRRELLAALGGAAAAWPLAARAQQSERVRRIGVFMNTAADDPAGQARLLAFAQTLAQSDWTDGRNVRMDIRWGAGDAERIRRYAAELVALAPDVILASGTTTLGPLRQVSRTVPTMFTGVADAVGAGFEIGRASCRETVE